MLLTLLLLFLFCIRSPPLPPSLYLQDFNPKVAKAASAAAEGLCTWVRAMKFYHGASKIVKPKLEALAIAEGKLGE